MSLNQEPPVLSSMQSLENKAMERDAEDPIGQLHWSNHHRTSYCILIDVIGSICMITNSWLVKWRTPRETRAIAGMFHDGVGRQNSIGADACFSCGRFYHSNVCEYSPNSRKA